METKTNNEIVHVGFRDHVIRVSIFLTIGIAFVLTLYIFKGMNLVDGLDACFATFWIFFGVGSWSIIVNYGTFDALCYSFANMVSTWHKDGQKKYKDLIDYKEIKQPKRKQKRFKFVDYYIVSAVFLITSIVLLIIYENSLLR